MTIIIRAAMGLVAAAAFTLSFSSLMRLGEFAGYGQLAFLYPLVVDLGAVASCAAWIHTRSRQALWMTWALLGISVVQNGTTHWLIATGRSPEWWLVTLVATIPPLTLGLVVHLAVGHQPRPAAADTPSSAVSAADAEVTPAAAGDRVAELIAEGAGRRKLAAELGVSEHQARVMLESHRGNGAVGR